MASAVRAWLVSLAVALAGGAADAQTFPALAKVKVPSASVRGAAGEFTPETGKLELGARVTVVAAEGNDWLAIQPPAGSISWVSWALVEPQGKPNAEGKMSPPFNAVVTPDDGAAIRAGAIGEAKPLGVQRTKLPKGTIVQVIGSRVKMKADGDDLETSWYPIIAPRDDVRFVRRDAVEWMGASPGPGFVVKAGGSTSTPLPGTQADPSGVTASKGDFTLSVPNGGRPQFPTVGGGTKPADWPNNHPLWREAEKARGSGETKQARDLYTKLAQQVSRDGPGQDLELANLCYDRIYNSLNGKGSNSGGRGEEAGWRPPASGGVVPADPPKAAARPIASGTLRSTTAKLDGKWPIYLLTDENRVVRHYVISGGADLERYVDRRVDLTGSETRPVSLRGDPVIVAKEVTAK